MKIETPILRLLGPVPFWRGEAKCLDELEGIYRRARRAARCQKVINNHHALTGRDGVRVHVQRRLAVFKVV